MNAVERWKQLAIVAIAFLLVCMPSFLPAAWAQPEKDYQEYSLGEIVVRSKGSAVRNIAISSEVTPEDFEAFNADSVAEALTYVPGVQVTYGRKFEPSINIHGFDKSRILTLIDGVPYYETKWGSLDMNQVDLEAISRIDVIKGAPSVLYGPNALGGVVNMVTKKPATEKPSWSATAEYGVDGVDDAYKVALSHGMRKGNLNYWLSYSHREWDSWDLSDDFEPRTGQIMVKPTVGRPAFTNAVLQNEGERVNSDYKTDNLWAKVGVEPSNDTEVYLNFHYVATEKSDPPSIDYAMVNYKMNFSQFDRITAYDDWGVDLSAEHTFTEAFSLQGKLYYHDHTDDYTSYTDETYTQSFAMSTYNDAIFGGILLGDLALADWDTLRFSLHYRKDFHEQRALESLPYAESEAYTGSLGLENEMSLWNDKLRLVTGISYDWYDVSKAQDDPNDNGNILEQDTPGTEDEINPMIGATYQVVDGVEAFASVAKKTRFPTLNQIFSGDQPNLDLEAETAINYTAGVSWTFRDLFRMEVAPFFHDISDFITRDVPPTQNPFSQYKNFDEVEVKGVEVDAEITPFEDLRLRIGYTANDASNESPQRISDDVLGVPSYTFNFNVQYTVPTFGTQLGWNMLYMGESFYQIPTPDDPAADVIKNGQYNICNVRITQPFASDRLKVFLAVENLFDEAYEPENGYPAPGMRAWVGLKFEI